MGVNKVSTVTIEIVMVVVLLLLPLHSKSIEWPNLEFLEWKLGKCAENTVKSAGIHVWYPKELHSIRWMQQIY